MDRVDEPNLTRDVNGARKQYKLFLFFRLTGPLGRL